jgi:hypothetical protein
MSFKQNKKLKAIMTYQFFLINRSALQLIYDQLFPNLDY